MGKSHQEKSPFTDYTSIPDDGSLTEREVIAKYRGFYRELGSHTLILCRYGAYGDHIFMSAILPFLFEKYRHVLLETNGKGMEIFQDDKRFAHISMFEPFNISDEMRLEVVGKHWQKILDRYPDYDFLNVWGAMEGTGIIWEEHSDAYLPREEKKRRYGVNFHEEHFRMANLKIPEGWMATDEMRFSDEWEEWAQNWRKENEDYFIMMVPIAGSTPQKVFPTWLASYCKYLIDKYPKLKIYLFGDQEAEGEDWHYERTVSWVRSRGKQMMSFKQAMLMTKYSDYVLGPETGLVAAAGMWGIPKTYLVGASEKEQLVKYHRNDHSVQSLAPCSPCYCTCFTRVQCELEMYHNLFPRCTVNYDWDEMLAIFERVYNAR